MNNKLKKDFYTQDALIVAPALLGKILCRKLKTGEEFRFRITETEAYCGENDTACHAKAGKTNRTAVLYKQGGFSYVYLCYGIHNLLNVVTGEENEPQAVLIRGVEGYDGPGKLTKKMQIDRSLNDIDLNESKEIWIEDDGFYTDYISTKRIGIDYATPEYRDKLWNFRLKKLENKS